MLTAEGLDGMGKNDLLTLQFPNCVSLNSSSRKFGVCVCVFLKTIFC